MEIELPCDWPVTLRNEPVQHFLNRKRPGDSCENE